VGGVIPGPGEPKHNTRLNGPKNYDPSMTHGSYFITHVPLFSCRPTGLGPARAHYQPYKREAHAWWGFLTKFLAFVGSKVASATCYRSDPIGKTYVKCYSYWLLFFCLKFVFNFKAIYPPYLPIFFLHLSCSFSPLLPPLIPTFFLSPSTINIHLFSPSSSLFKSSTKIKYFNNL